MYVPFISVRNVSLSWLCESQPNQCLEHIYQVGFHRNNMATHPEQADSCVVGRSDPNLECPGNQVGRVSSFHSVVSSTAMFQGITEV